MRLLVGSNALRIAQDSGRRQNSAVHLELWVLADCTLCIRSGHVHVDDRSSSSICLAVSQRSASICATTLRDDSMNYAFRCSRDTTCWYKNH
jgi:hypothetical protein